MTKKRLYVIAIVLPVFILLVLLCVHNYKVYYLPKSIENEKLALRGDKNYDEYVKIQKGMSRKELLKRMSKPVEIRKTEKGTIFVFEEPVLASGPIQILIDDKSNTVIGKKFSENDWEYFVLPVTK